MLLAAIVVIALWIDDSPHGPRTLTPKGRDGDEPALSSAAAWATYLTSDGLADEIWLQSLEEDAVPLAVSDTAGALHQPVVAETPRGPLVVWAGFAEARWDLFCHRPDASAPERLTDSPAPDRAPVLCALPGGRLALAWIGPSPDDPSALFVLLRLWSVGGGWDEEQVVPQSRGAWRVATVSDENGHLWIAWDSYRGEPGGYDVSIARRSENGDWIGPWAVAASERFESHPDLAAHGSSVVIAWQEGSTQWGLEGSTNLEDVALHDRREVKLARVDAEGTLTSLALPGPLRSLSEAGNLELPRIARNGRGDLLVVARTMQDVVDNTKRYRFVAWQTLAASSGSTAAIPVGPPGRNDQGPAVAGRESDFVVLQAGDDRSVDTAFQKDRQPIWFHPTTQEHANRVVMLSVEAEGDLTPSGTTRRLEPLAAVERSSGAGKVTVGGETFHRTFGDLHRHSDLSRCSANLDGTIEDCYRYAFGPGALDFVALTDHSAHLTRYDWWRLRKAVDLYAVPGSGVALFGYERSSLVFGHRNILSPERDLPLISWKNFARPERDDGTAPTPRELFRLLQASRGRAITIPHSPGGQSQNDPFGIDWSYHDPKLERLVEIFQSYRGSYEGEGAPRLFDAATRPDRFVEEGLGRGYRLGFIASSDHQSSGGAYAVAYTLGPPTRESVFEALFQRRCYAATAKIDLLFLADDRHWMGSVIETSRPPRLRIEVRGTAPLKQVDILRDGAIVHSPPVPPGEVSFEHEWTPSAAITEETFIYVRIVQTDDEMAWSSPIWLRPPQ